MFYNLKVFGKNLARQRTVGILSIASLSVAIAVVILIGLWAANEFSFDKFQKDGDKIYRLCGEMMINNENTIFGSTYKAAGQDAIQHFPDILAMCRVVPQSIEIKINDRLYPANLSFMADSNFFTFFTFPLKVGDARTCLLAPDGVVIDEYTVNRYFAGQNPMGKNITIQDKEFTVTGIMYDMPDNSHLKAHIVAPFIGYFAEDLGYGTTDNFITYLKIGDTSAISGIEEGMLGIIQKVFNQYENTGMKFEYKLQPLEDIHFNNDFKFDAFVIHGNKSLVMVFVLTALVILLIACINFINLFISTSFLRARTVGVKKTHGAGKAMLIGEFYRETFYYVLLAVGLGLFLAVRALPLFNRLADYDLKMDFMSWELYVFLFVLILFIILAAGTFPALYMTKFNAVQTLKGQFKGKNLSFLQKSLIISQFTASIVILIAVFFISKQVHFMISKDLGFDKENILYVYDRGGFTRNYEAFRSEMKNNLAISDVSVKDVLPDGWCRGDAIRKSGGDQNFLFEFCQIEPNYFDLMGMAVVTGGGFREGSNDSALYCILNETAVRQLGFKDPVGEKVFANGGDYIVKGVVKDAQTKSLHRQVDPQIYFEFSGFRGNEPILFKVKGDPQEAIRAIGKKWNELNPKTPFEYHFLDARYARMYTAETTAGQVLGAAMMITLIISVAGLFAMAYYTTQRRLKEIGVRKVNGASVSELLLILNRDFFVWVGISFLLACPLAYFFVSRWMEGFTDRTAMSWWVFLSAGAITFFVTLLTVSYQTWKAANVNPVKVLKSE